MHTLHDVTYCQDHQSEQWCPKGRQNVPYSTTKAISAQSCNVWVSAQGCWQTLFSSSYSFAMCSLHATIFPYQECVVCWFFLMYLWCLIVRFSPFLPFACGGIWIASSHKIVMVDDYYSFLSLSPYSTWWHRCNDSNVMGTRLQIMLPASLVCTIMHHYCMYL